MRGHRIASVMILLAAGLTPHPSRAQTTDVYWHIDPSVQTCSMVIDPALTQSQWRTFTRQAGAMVSCKSLASAEPLGARNFAVSLDYSVSPVDQHDPAWINTFTHPDETCPLGDQIRMPMLRARMGVSNKMDVGAFWTKAPGANYGLVGGELKYALRQESPHAPAAAVSASYSLLTGVPDFNFSVYSVGLMASKKVAFLTPYLGARGNVAVGTETTSKVNLSRETQFLPQAYIGTTYDVWKLGLAAEYNVADVSTFAFVIGYHP